MKRFVLLILISFCVINNKVVAQDAATLFNRANDQYVLFEGERNRESSSTEMYNYLYKSYELYIKVLESPANDAQRTGAKKRLQIIYPYLIQGAAFFSEHKQPMNFLNLATAYIELPRRREFRSESFRRSEQYSGLLYNAGRGYLELKQYELAIKYLREFLSTEVARNELLRDAYVFLNDAYKEQKNYVQQENVLEEAAAKYPLDINILLNLVNVHITTKNNQKLLNTVERVLRIDPNNLQVLPLKAKLLRINNKHEEALAVLERLYTLQSGDFIVLKDLAVAYYNAGNEVLNNRTIDEDKATLAMKMNRAAEYFLKAQDLFVKILEKEPLSITHMQGIAQIHKYMGQEAEYNVLTEMIEDKIPYDKFQMRLIAYREVHGQQGATIAQGSFSSAQISAVPKLIIDSVELLDRNGNAISQINAGELFSIKFKVHNKGNGDANNLRLSLLEHQGLETYFDGPRDMDGGHISVGGTQSYELKYIATGDMPTMMANIEIRVNEQNGFNADPFLLTVPTIEYARPNLCIVDYIFEAKGASSITLGSEATLALAVQNRGVKTAHNVKLNFALPTHVFRMSESEISLDSLPPGGVEKIEFLFSVNKLFGADSIAIAVTAREETHTSFVDETFRVKLGEYLNTGGRLVLNSDFERPEYTIDYYLHESNELLEKIPIGGKNPHRYALIIGNEDYTRAGASAESNVPYAIRDAAVFFEYCTNTLGLSKEHIHVHSNATAGLMREEIDWLINVASTNPNVEIFFYYSGHGSNDEATREAYLLPTDLTGKNVTHGISLSELYKRLGLLSVKGAYVFLDACFSGSYKSAAPLISQKGVSVEPRISAPQGHTLSFSSSSGTQTSNVYDAKKHGYYTYYLLKTLQEADGNLSLRDWFISTAQKVKEATAEIGKMQTPQVMPSKDWPEWENIQLKTQP